MPKRVNRLLLGLKNNRSLVLIFGLGIIAFLLLLLLNHRIPGSDDTVFQTQILPFPDVFSWIIDRYHTWSGRIFSEGFVYLFSPAPFYAWQIVTLGVFALFCGMLFAYVKLFNTPTRAHTRLMLIAAFCMLFLMDHHVLAEGGLWMTGSMVYFWTTVISMVAFYPVAYYFIKRRTPHWLLTSLGVVAAIIAASSQEQVGAVLLGLTIAFIAYRLWSESKQSIPRFPVIFGLIITASLLFSILAPGNAVRLEAETATWLPNFPMASIGERIEYGYRWLLEVFVNHTGFLLVASWLFMSALFARKNRKTIVDYAFIFIFCLASILVLSSGSELTSHLVTFFATWNPTIPNSFVSFNLLPWGVVLLCTLVAPLFLFPKKPFGYFLSTTYAASLASAGILLLSPTMYASLWRSFFVPSVLLIVAAYFLLDRVLQGYPKYRYVIISLIGSVALLHFIFQAARLAQ